MDFSTIIPVIIALVEIAKRVPQIPVTKKNAGWVVALISTVICVGSAYGGGYINDVNTVSANIGILSVLIYGFYEAIKQVLTFARIVMKRILDK